MISYQTLTETNIETLHEAFIEAFSDYQVKIDLPFWKFQQMLQRRGYRPEISIGAFDDEHLVGFSLSGARDWNGSPTAYDVATGVLPACRRQGITSQVFLHIKDLLKEHQVGRYMLEVIQTNRPAVQLYQKQGFTIQREFSCYRIQKSAFTVRELQPIERVEEINFAQVQKFWDFAPSWQNSCDSIRAIPEAFACFEARIDHRLAGYGVIEKRTGDIPQLAVDRGDRNTGVAGSLLSAMIRDTEADTLSILNVEAQQEPMNHFLTHSGFNHLVDQYEMILEL
jgi:ribosomal protein S18 acetylase RimI-like enzyme